MLDVELVKERSGTKEELLRVLLGEGIVPPGAERTFVSLRCPPTIPIYYGELHILIIMGNDILPYILGNNIFPYITGNYILPLLRGRAYSPALTWTWFITTSAKPSDPTGIRQRKAKARTNNNFMLKMGNRNLLIYVGGILATWGRQICSLIFRLAAL